MTDAATLESPTDEAVDTKGKAPLATFRSRNISASVFANESKNGGTFHTVTLERAYKDADENWQHSSSFLRDEVPVATHLADQAWAYILQQEAKSSEQ